MENRDGFRPVTDFVWPITLNWEMSVPWGRAHLEVTVDVPSLLDQLIPTGHMVNNVWREAVAPATSFLTTLVDGSAKIWKYGFSVDRDTTFPVGQRGIFPTGASHGVAVVMHTGHSDRHAKRRLIVPAVPSAWIDSRGQLTAEGAGEMLTWARGLFAGLNGTIENAPMTWLIPYPDAIKDPVTGLGTVGFRAVTHLRICQYTVPVPVAL